MTFLRSYALCILGCLALIWGGCGAEQPRLFERLSPERTGVRFSNSIVQDDSLMNPLNFLYLYNGGGVAVGDVNGDQRPDLYFAGNQVENRLYLNQGDFRFRNVTEQAGVAAEGIWSTGVSMVDVNQDGLLDVYVSVGGPKSAGESRANKLFVNQGLGPDSIPTFEEKAHSYGIASTGYTTHAAFFDYDRDGDLDLYVLNNAMDEAKHFLRPKRTDGEAESTDRLYRNNGDGTFTDVSQEAGIQIEGYGLGVGIADVNKDGWPDIYVANDFITNDLLYMNNGDGTFTNRIGQYLKHQPYSAMGVDVADMNNDMRVDIMALDMLPGRNPRLRLVPKAYHSQRARRMGYEPQYVRNTLQLNNGPSPTGHLTFSEISQLAGVDATGWSWAPLFADFDNDGDRDLFVSNGYGKDVTNLDFVDRRQNMAQFGTQDTKREQLLKAYEDLPRIALPNRFFENRDRPSSAAEAPLRFADRTGEWASDQAGISNGAAFADLDRDGDLDLVTNNLNDHASILENHASERDSSQALRVRLHGPPNNQSGLGAKVRLSNDGTTQYHDHTVYRGYQSTVGRVVHFGLGADSTADSLSVMWPDGRRQQLTDVRADQTVDIYHENAIQKEEGGGSSTSSATASSPRGYHLSEVASERGLTFEHTERARSTNNKNPLVPHTYSRNGPGIAVGDVNGDGRDDVFVGADPGQERTLFLQTPSGDFTERPLRMDTKYEDMGALFFDADGDGDLDLYVVSGGNAGSRKSPLYQDRLYLNDGRGRFARAPDALPRLHTSGSVVTAADYDEDGDLDLFVGGRVQPGNYPLPPRSFLLRNDSEGETVTFTAVTEEVAPDLKKPGLVTDALWTDYDTDGDRDLMVVGEWMPVRVYRNEDGHFDEVTNTVGLEGTSGWWNSLTAGDFDRDGDPDYVVGNHGLNTKYETSPQEPVQIYAKDFDQNGDLDPVMSRYINGTQVPAHERDDLVEQIPAMKDRFPSYREYGKASFDEVLTPSEQSGAYVRSAARFETSYLENREDGTFEVRALPVRAQTAPVFGMVSGDYNGDGILDLLMIGNWYAPQKPRERADAFIGAFFRGDGTGDFQYVDYTKSGFYVDGDGKGLAEVSTGGRTSLVLAAQNDGPLKAFQSPPREGKAVTLNPRDQYAQITFSDGSTRRHEFYWGSSYLSQSSRVLWVPPEAERVVIHNPQGPRRPISSGSSSSQDS